MQKQSQKREVTVSLNNKLDLISGLVVKEKLHTKRPLTTPTSEDGVFTMYKTRTLNQVWSVSL